MWTKYFKLVGLRRGRVITPSHGEIDFSRDDITVETCKQLFESDFPYLEITEEGEKEIYGIVETPAFDTPIPSTASRSGQGYSGGDALLIEPAVAEPVEATVGEPVEPPPIIDLPETVETEVSPPNRKKYVKKKSS